MAILTVVGFGLRMILLDRFPLREDEAIYSYWALRAWYDDPFFLAVWPDKPPLFIWLLAGAFQLWGALPASARILNIGLSTLMIPVVAVIARRLWGSRAALVAASLMACSPFAVAFAPTAYTDTLLVAAGMLAVVMALSVRTFWAGFWLGVAIMTKQQGIFYGPLIFGLLWLTPSQLHHGRPVQQLPTPRSVVTRLLTGVTGLLVVVLPIIYWDSRRWAVAPSPWDLAARNYGTVAPADPSVWAARWADWRDLGWHLMGSWGGWLALSCLTLAALTAIWARRSTTAHAPTTAPRAFLLALWTGGFVAFHLLSTVQIWDRYLLPLAPMVALLGGWAAAHVPLPHRRQHMTGCSAEGTNPRARLGGIAGWLMPVVLLGALLVAALPPAWAAAHGRLPLGGDHGDQQGLEEAMTYVAARAADPARRPLLLYHDVLGWQSQFYLFAPVAAQRVELRWFSSSTYLADNIEKSAGTRAFYIQADWAVQADLAQRLAMRGLALHQRLRSGHVTVYEVTAATNACSWCVCAAPRDGRSRNGQTQSPGDGSAMGAFGWPILGAARGAPWSMTLGVPW